MKIIAKFLLIFVIAACLAGVGLPAAARGAPDPAAPPQIARVNLQEIQVPGLVLVLGDVYSLEDGETVAGTLGVLGGIANLAAGSTVQGDVVLLGGTLKADGSIEGDVISLGGLLILGNESVVEGQVQQAGGSLQREAGSVVEGGVNDNAFVPFVFPESKGLEPFNFNFDNFTGVGVPRFDNPLYGGLWLLLRSFIWAIVAVLIALFLPNALERVGNAAVGQPLISAGLGCLTAFVLPVVLVLLAITIICIPLSLIGVLVLVVGWAYGMIALGTEVGRRLARAFKAEWALAVSAGLGTFLLTVVVNGIGEFVPCIGGIVPLLAGILALGAVLLTRFGARAYPEMAASAVEFNTPGTAEIQDTTSAGIQAEDFDRPQSPGTGS